MIFYDRNARYGDYMENYIIWINNISSGSEWNTKGSTQGSDKDMLKLKKITFS